MRRFQHTQNGRIVRLLEVFEKSGAMLVEYEDDGSTRNYSAVTIRRWWKELPEVEDATGTDEVVEEVKPAEKQKVTKKEEVAGDGTPYKQVMKEILADEKLAVEKKAKKEKTTVKKSYRQDAEYIPSILSYIEQAASKINATSYIRDKQPSLINYRIGEHKVIFMLRKTHRDVQLFVKSQKIPEKYAKSLESVNGFYDKKLSIVNLNNDVKLLIDNIISSMKEELKDGQS